MRCFHLTTMYVLTGVTMRNAPLPADEFATLASALRHTTKGDYNMVIVAEVEKLRGSDGSGRIQR